MPLGASKLIVHVVVVEIQVNNLDIDTVFTDQQLMYYRLHVRATGQKITEAHRVYVVHVLYVRLHVYRTTCTPYCLILPIASGIEVVVSSLFSPSSLPRFGS